jgi:hypothetical protein
VSNVAMQDRESGSGARTVRPQPRRAAPRGGPARGSRRNAPRSVSGLCRTPVPPRRMLTLHTSGSFHGRRAGLG